MYNLHYFIFPALVILSAFFAIYKLFIKKGNAITLLSILFFAVFYIFNFQRGLIRHSLAEGWDTALSSFVFFILTLTLIEIVNIKKGIRYFTAFLIFSFVLVYGFHFPYNSVDKKTNASMLIAKCDTVKTNIDYNQNRILLDSIFFETKINNFKEFLDNNLDSNETFIDFTNTPMLYFYTHRENPNYFSQPLLSNHSDYLQDRFIEQLEDYKIPIIVYSNYPKTWWDASDNIPNHLRYYKISEYLNKNYKPYSIINNRCIWVKQDDKRFKNSKNIKYQITNLSSLKTSNTLILDTIFKNFTASRFKQIIFNIDSTVKINKEKKYLFKINIKSNKQKKLSIKYKTNLGNFNEDIDFSNENGGYVILNTKGANKISNIEIKFNTNEYFTFDKITLFEYDVIPDFYSEQFNDRPNIGLIPYIWGNFDEKIANQEYEIIEKISGNDSIAKNKSKIYRFNTENTEHINYILISAKVKKDNTLYLTYMSNGKSMGGYTIKIKKSDEFVNYVIRVSADYNWQKNIDRFRLSSANHTMEIEKIELIKEH